MPKSSRVKNTQVGIIGAGPAGLVLSHRLHQMGIGSIVLESRSREHVEGRIRAGVLEQNTVDLLTSIGVADRLHKEALVHHGVEFRFSGRSTRIPLTNLTGGRAIYIYGQRQVLKDLIQARLDTGGEILFEAEATRVEGLDNSPHICYEQGGNEHTIQCEYVAGCDGFHGVSRKSIPNGVLKEYSHEYPFGWVGILADVPPSTEELIYAFHANGFALHSLRSPTCSRLYVQSDIDDNLENWPDERIWAELHVRLATDGWSLNEGPILEKTFAPLRTFVAEPMQYQRLFLAGDAAHIVPPTGAKGLNLAVADVRVLSQGLIKRYESGCDELLQRYSETRLGSVWRTQGFSNFITKLMHLQAPIDTFDYKLQEAAFDYICTSETAARALAENYVGIPEN
ncbi:MAG: 4-hydroxybenzoate 3-monooxygenase [Candidatus Poribacteria bacterium]|nr:4-hydroxybenzoate 3-monooxygenase [Candidatus Poribacteria bacterium]MDE0503123.1 4-hydroxybenzoate 3-monooxygenase [Candidatus Poribacteria bacterium]